MAHNILAVVISAVAESNSESQPVPIGDIVVAASLSIHTSSSNYKHKEDFEC